MMHLFIIAFPFIYSHFSWAAYSNYESVLIGDQAAGMGGAYTAMYGDAAAAPFYNPGSLANIKGETVSASVSVYKKFDTVYGANTDLTEATLRANQGFFRALPSSSASVLRWKDYVLALSILVPDYDHFNGEVRTGENSSSLLNVTDESLWVGASISKALTDKFSLGASVYYTARSFHRIVSEEIVSGSDNILINNEEKTFSTNNLVVVFGLHEKLTEDWNAGVSFRMPGIRISGDGSYFATRVESDPFSQTTVNVPEIKAVTIIPARLSIGVAYSKLKNWSLAFSTQFYFPAKYRDYENETYADIIQHKSVVNFAFGFEYYFLDWLTLRSGLYTNLSSHPDPDPSLGVRQGDHIDQLGFSANLSMKTKNAVSYTFGGYFTGGTGTSLQQLNDNLESIVKSYNVFTMLIGTSVEF